jgi:hypothetical protein
MPNFELLIRNVKPRDKFLSIFLVFLPWVFGLAHPFFVSMTEMVFNPKEKTLEISIRVFTDDLEKELAKSCQCRVNLGEEENHKKMEEILAAYFNKQLKISINQKVQKPGWAGFQNEEESTWCFLEIKTEAPTTLQIENRILHLTQEKQVNLIRYKKPGFDKTIQLAYPETTAKF